MKTALLKNIFAVEDSSSSDRVAFTWLQEDNI